jgi:triosephosphate isomerase
LRKVIVGVWKDRLSLNESVRMAEELSRLCKDLTPSSVVSAVAPAPYAAHDVCELLKRSAIQVVYQDVHWPARDGSYIGSTPIRVVSELGVRFSLVGHSERRRFFGEKDADINCKLVGLIDAGIHPILCVGDDVEDWAERRKILVRQLTGALRSNTGGQINIRQLTIAYEPVWAISTWRSDRSLPSGEEVGAMLALVREVTQEVTGGTVEDTSFLFGGSVGPSNADEYFATPGVDGALVGGASLKAGSMAAVFRSGAAAWSASS